MGNHVRLRLLVGGSLLLAGLPAGLASAQTPVGTAFTYQGRLTDGGTPANGPYDFDFRLFDAALGGAQIGSPVVLDDVSVAAGLFSAALDFGAAAFNGSARFLEVRIRPGASTGAYTALPTRQPLTPSPYAIDSVRLGGLAASAYQVRVSGNCAVGSSVRAIGGDGTVTCEAVGLSTSGGALTGPLDMGGQKVTSLGAPGVGADAANKAYVDGGTSALATSLAGLQTTVSGIQTTLGALQTTVGGIQTSAAFLSASQTFTGTNTFSAAGNLFTGIVRFSSAPAVCSAGDAGLVRYDTLSLTLKFCDGSAWRTIATTP